MNHPFPVWLDLDTGVDDAMALMTACALDRNKMFEIKGVSAVSGNVSLLHTFENTRNVLHYAGRSDIPVYPGAERPLIKEAKYAAYVHGENGLGNASLSPSPAKRESMKAWDALYKCAIECGSELELILTGPQTNAAIAFTKYPDLKKHIRRILFMGGADIGGNITASAEFNIFADPHSAQIVMQTGVPLIMCGLDVTNAAGLTMAQVEFLENSGTPAGDLLKMTSSLSKSFGGDRMGEIYAIHDVCPVMYAVYPELFKGILCGVQVETRGKLTMGQTVTDWNTDVKFQEKNVYLILGADQKRFSEILIDLLQNYKIHSEEK